MIKKNENEFELLRIKLLGLNNLHYQANVFLHKLKRHDFPHLF
jgi:hypothetical protein